MGKRMGIGNIHCHHINGDCVPNNLTKQQTGKPEWFLRCFLANIVGRIFVGRHIEDFLRIMRSRDIGTVTQYHVEQKDDAGIDYSIVLSLDFSCIDPEYHGYNIDFEIQLEETAKACARHPFRFFPFFGFEARRPGVIDLLKNAHEKYGIVGIKMYPAFGYDPRPEKNDFIPPVESDVEDISQVLKNLYEFADEKNLPILTHCSPGGSYQCTIREEEKYKKIWGYTEPSNFLKIGFEYGLRICFAHMGGNVYKKGMRELAMQWFNQICNLISYAHEQGSKCRFYTDRANALAYIFKKRRKREDHFQQTADLFSESSYSPYILFGSDWPLGMHLFNENEYLKKYKSNLNQDAFSHYTQKNISQFLFGEELKIPDNYIEYLKRYNNGDLPELPDWIEEKDGFLKLVSD